MDDDQIKSAAVDIFCYIVEFSPVTVREFMVREARQQDDVSVTCLASPVIDHLPPSLPPVDSV